MTFVPSFKIGETVSNEQLYTEFSCGNMGGIRPSSTNNCVVLISDHTKSLYDDKWYGNELHYTGTGKIDDQSLDDPKNKKIAKSNTTGIALFLFEVMEPTRYTYRGQMKLSGNPYQEVQPDDNGNLRKVWMFPLTAVEEQSITQSELKNYVETQRKKVQGLPISELRQQAIKHKTKVGSNRPVTSNTYIRDEFIAEYTKRYAKGVCELCEKDAPFKDKGGNPYLESHHIIWLSKGGPDSIENTVALCPNCHRKMHIVADQNDINKLLTKAKERAQNE